MGKQSLGSSRMATAILMISLMIAPSVLSVIPFNGSAQGGTEHLVHLTYPTYSYPFPQIKGTINVTGTAYDPHGNADIKNVTFAVGPIYPIDEHNVGPLIVTTYNSYTDWFIVWDSTELLDGDYRITIELTDKQGWSMMTFSNITLNNTGGSPPPDQNLPEVTISVKNRQIISGRTLIIGDAWDPEHGTGPGQYVTKVEIKIDDGPWIQVADIHPWEYSLDTTLLEDGWHDLYARSFDGYRYSTPHTASFLCDNDPSNDPPVPLWGGDLGIVDYIGGSGPFFKDFDGDRDLDIISGSVGDHLNYYKNIGNVREPLWAASTMGFPPDAYNKILRATVDLDSNGTQDLVYQDRQTHSLEVFRNVGSPAEPSWSKPEPLVADAKFGDATWFSFADIDKDGDQDLLISDGIYGWGVYLNGGNATVPSYSSVSGFTSGLPVPLTYDFFLLEDVDADGNLELCLALFNNTADGTLHMFRRSGTLGSSPWTEDKDYFSTVHGNISALALPDLDNDGDRDLVIHNCTNKLILYWNKGNSTVPNWSLAFDPVANIPSPWGRPPVLVDFDRDGDQDLWVPDCSKPNCWDLTYQYYENTGSPKDAKFTFRPNIGASLPKDDEILFVAFPDLNADGKVELLVFWDNSAGWGAFGDILNASYYTNSGNSSVPKWTKTLFDSPQIPKARKVLFHDMDMDGDLDMVFATNEGGTMWVRNIGSASSFLWEKKTTSFWVTTHTPEYLQLDGKGELELIDWSGVDGGIKVYLRPLAYERTEDNRYFLNHSFGDRVDLTSGDIDGDGDKDLVMSDYYHTVKIVKNLGLAFSGPTMAPLGIVAAPGEQIRFDVAAMVDQDQLNDTSEFSWDFGDGTVTSWSLGTTVFHNFTATGEHAVVLHIRNTAGPVSIQSYVIVRSVPKSPIAIIDAPGTVMEGVTVSLSGARSYDPDGSIVDYQWNITGYDINKVTYGKEISQVFWSPVGIVNVALTVKDGSGLFSTTSVSLRVTDNPAWENPVNATAQGPKIAPMGTPVRFNVTATSTSAPGGWIRDYSWNFGDGQIAEPTDPFINHTFKKAGKFNVTVYVRDNRQHGTELKLNITIFDPANTTNFPEAVMDSPSSGYVNEDLQLSGASSYARLTGLSIVRYRWDLGDGNFSDAPSLTYRYNRTGRFNISLVVYDQMGLQGSAVQSIVISNRGSGNGNQPPANSSVNLLVPVGLICALIIMIVLISFLKTEVGLLGVMPGLFLMYTKLKHVEVLDHYVRGKIMGIVQLNPGQTYTSIKDELELPNGTLSYHLKVMEQEEFIFSRREGLLKRFYPASKSKELRPVTLEEQILGILRRNPGISQKELAKKTGIELLKIHRALHKLNKGGIVQIVKDGKSTKCFINNE